LGHGGKKCFLKGLGQPGRRRGRGRFSVRNGAKTGPRKRVKGFPPIDRPDKMFRASAQERSKRKKKNKK